MTLPVNIDSIPPALQFSLIFCVHSQVAQRQLRQVYILFFTGGSSPSLTTRVNGRIYRRGSRTGCKPVVFNDSGGSSLSSPTNFVFVFFHDSCNVCTSTCG